MSLFASAFDAPSSAGPSKASSPLVSQAKPQTQNQKRKRPASLTPKDDQLRSTQINLEKLMSKVEKGQIKEKNVGRESMDDTSFSKKKKGDHGAAGNGEKVYQRPLGKKARHSLPGVGTDAIHPSRMAQVDSSSSKQFKGLDKSPAKAEQSKVTTSNPNRPAPAELPLPHDLSASELSNGKDQDENLTPLQKGMKAKLEGARFRWINEQLYSTPSTEAVEMMKKDPKIFADYHLTHRALTSAWPSPPLPHIIDLLKPLPERTIIVDLGCGDAGLARALVPTGKVVLSYDLVGDSGVPGSSTASGAGGKSKGMGEGWVVEADFLESVPLPGRPGGSDYSLPQMGSAEVGEVEGGKKKKKGKGVKAGKGEEKQSEIVDVVVCCLSLMGINWVGGIYEACRVLKQGGQFHIAEVTSRFISTDEFIAKIESFGFTLDSQDSPSTHFTLFSFTKSSAVPLGSARGQKGWQERVADGEQILRGCVYKKR